MRRTRIQADVAQAGGAGCNPVAGDFERFHPYVCDLKSHDRFAGTPLDAIECQQWLANKTSPGALAQMGEAADSKSAQSEFESQGRHIMMRALASP